MFSAQTLSILASELLAVEDAPKSLSDIQSLAQKHIKSTLQQHPDLRINLCDLTSCCEYSSCHLRVCHAIQDIVTFVWGLRKLAESDANDWTMNQLFCACVAILHQLIHSHDITSLSHKWSVCVSRLVLWMLMHQDLVAHDVPFHWVAVVLRPSSLYTVLLMEILLKLLALGDNRIIKQAVVAEVTPFLHMQPSAPSYLTQLRGLSLLMHIHPQMFSMSLCRRLSYMVAVFIQDKRAWSTPLNMCAMHLILSALYAALTHWSMNEIEAHEIYSNLLGPVVIGERKLRQVKNTLSLIPIARRLILLADHVATPILQRMFAVANPEQQVILQQLFVQQMMHALPDIPTDSPDCVLFVGKRFWQCHKSVLMLQSQTLARIMQKDASITQISLGTIPIWAAQLVLQHMYSPACLRIDTSKVETIVDYGDVIVAQPALRVIPLCPKDLAIIFLVAKKLEIQSMMDQICHELMTTTIVDADTWLRLTKFLIHHDARMENVLVKIYLYALSHASVCKQTLALQEARWFIESHTLGFGCLRFY